MKSVLVIVIALMLTAAGASAQKVIVGGRVGYGHPVYRSYGYHPYYGFGLGLGYGYGYPYYGYPYGQYYNRPTRMERQIIDIQNDYADRINSARMDNSLTGRERRQEIRTLRQQRREAIDDARRNYYRQPYRSYNNNYNQNNSNNNYQNNSQQ